MRAGLIFLPVAAVTMERTALAANLVFTVPHFVFHATHPRPLPGGGR